MPVQHETRPRGRYLAHDVGRLAGVSGLRIGQWARRGYIRPSQGKGRPNVYSYQDVAEAMVVHELEELGSSLTSIKLAIQRLHARFGNNWPLQRTTLASYHGQVVEVDGDEYFDLGGAGSEWQSVLAPGNLRKIALQLERGGWAVRDAPDLQHIEVNPDRLSGRPVIRDRRISAEEVAALAVTDEGRTILVEEYDLDESEINDALRWWEVTRSYESAS